MVREFTVVAVVCAIGGLLVVGLSAQEPLRFEVASIRPSPSQPVGPVGVRVTQSEARFSFVSLKAYICVAFGLRDHQVDGPQWLSTTRFDIVAKRPEGVHSLNQVPGMMQALLVERFRLRTHWARRDFPVYGLELAPQGPPLNRMPDEAPPEGPFTALSGPSAGRKVSTFGDGSTLALGDNRFEATRMTMAMLADSLTPFVDRPVVNMTGAEGRYDVAFTLAADDFLAMMRRSVAAAGFAVPAEDFLRLDATSTVAVRDALEQVGLRLQPQRAPLDVLVIDSLDRVPTAN
jgi:uncharacterized protein (TIGR03435 family)